MFSSDGVSMLNRGKDVYEYGLSPPLSSLDRSDRVGELSLFAELNDEGGCRVP